MANVFSLRGRALKLDTAEDLKQHVQELEENDNVEEVHIEGNTIGVGAAEALASILQTKKNLRVANLADLFTGRLLAEIPPALDALLKALLKCPRLHTVNLNDNAFGLNTVEPLRPFLSQHTPLQHLYLNNNGLGPAAGTLVAEALEQLAARKSELRKQGTEVPDLETVICGRNRLESGSMAAWAKAYQANNRVRTVKMVQNGIRQEGIAALIQHGLSHCTALEVLDLQDNTFTAVAATTLAKVVPEWTKIRELGVSDCLLSARGGIKLAEALSQGRNTLLQVLRLQFNDIDRRGLAALATAASGSSVPHLRRIELNGNKFEEEDPNIEKLSNVLAANKEKHSDSDIFKDVDEDDEDAWGVDELDELEEDDDDEDEDDVGSEDEDEAKAERVVQDADRAESEPVAQDKDADVDALANALDKTQIK